MACQAQPGAPGRGHQALSDQDNLARESCQSVPVLGLLHAARSAPRLQGAASSRTLCTLRSTAQIMVQDLQRAGADQGWARSSPWLWITRCARCAGRCRTWCRTCSSRPRTASRCPSSRATRAALRSSAAGCSGRRAPAPRCWGLTRTAAPALAAWAASVQLCRWVLWWARVKQHTQQLQQSSWPQQERGLSPTPQRMPDARRVRASRHQATGRLRHAGNAGRSRGAPCTCGRVEPADSAADARSALCLTMHAPGCQPDSSALRRSHP